MMENQHDIPHRSVNPINRSNHIHPQFPEARLPSRTKPPAMTTSPPEKPCPTFSDLPLKIRQTIFSSTITPFRRPKAPLGYVLDPIVQSSFCNQCATFDSEFKRLRQLPSFITGGSKWLKIVERRWREEWLATMRDMIDQDRKFWKGKSVNFYDVQGQEVIIDDICTATKQASDSQLVAIFRLIKSLNERAGYEKITKDTAKRVIMGVALNILRQDAIRHSKDAVQKMHPESIAAQGLGHQQFEREKRHSEILAAEEKAGIRQLERALGLGRVLNWGSRSWKFPGEPSGILADFLSKCTPFVYTL